MSAFFFLHTAPADYTATTADLTFDAEVNRQCLNIPIVNDTRTEGPEIFIGILWTSEVRVNLDPNNTVLHIMDDDGKNTMVGCTCIRIDQQFPFRYYSSVSQEQYLQFKTPLLASLNRM